MDKGQQVNQWAYLEDILNEIPKVLFRLMNQKRNKLSLHNVF
ncbi:unnamed protein product [Paramecium octaurelia]|uniref:Uncharacterized protein n=1 Tax=Paramecium octaurelia TaxID=43137 RepID=A0A8S1W6M2_PAROT|nr:unnamed protein product [Paramecium octaurelia]